MIKKILISISLLLFSFTPLKAEELKEIGKFKDWQTMVLIEPTGTVCFAQSSPVLQAPKSNQRDARLFVTFRPNEKIIDEISASPGYEFNQNNSVTATSGKEKIKFDILQQGFAWIADNKIEKKMVTGYNQNGSQTIDHYSLLGFTKAYNAAKTACS